MTDSGGRERKAFLAHLPSGRGRRWALVALSAFFTLAGVAHFRRPDFYIPMVPPYLPDPEAIVFVSGVLEIAGGLAVLHRALRPWAGVGLVLLLVAVFPANVHMALNPELFPDMSRTAALREAAHPTAADRLGVLGYETRSGRDGTPRRRVAGTPVLPGGIPRRIVAGGEPFGTASASAIRDFAADLDPETPE